MKFMYLTESWTKHGDVIKTKFSRENFDDIDVYQYFSENNIGVYAIRWQ